MKVHAITNILGCVKNTLKIGTAAGLPLVSGCIIDGTDATVRHVHVVTPAPVVVATPAPAVVVTPVPVVPVVPVWLYPWYRQYLFVPPHHHHR